MSKYELQIDYEYFENDQCEYNDLKTAISRLTSSTQADFEEIKKEKWFNRVFDMMTFSKKNDIRASSQIGNLAQAQQIIMEILVKLSERDKGIYELVEDSFDKIERLSENDLLLAKKLKKLENFCILGIGKDSDIGALNEVERKILAGLYIYLMEKFKDVSEAQKVYANGILTYLEIEPSKINIQESIESLNSIEIKKMIFESCLEYGFLNALNFDFIDTIDEIIGDFDFGNKTISQIKNKINSIYKLRGVDGFINKYFEDDDEEEGIYLEIINEIETEVIEKTELVINKILHVAKDEKKVFTNNIIQLKAYVNCEGNLEFNNCTVYYNEALGSDEITLSEGATLNFLSCSIICKNNDETAFIQCKGDNKITLQNCDLENCSYFIDSRNGTDINIQNCIFLDPFKKCISGNIREFILNKSIVRFTIKSQENVNDHSFQGSVFDCRVSDDKLRAAIIECTVLGEADFHKDKININIFKIAKAVFENCSFQNIDNCILGSVTEINSCSFTNCNDVIHVGRSIPKLGSLVKNCNFKCCEDIIKAEQKTTIVSCQFSDCKNHLISSGFDGDLEVEFCEFYNVYCDMASFIESATACICFSRSKGSDSISSTMKKCLFDGVNIENGFLISGYVVEKIEGVAAYIEDCDFRNIKTKNPSGKIIRENDFYIGLFNKQKEVKVVTIKDCKGLDSINK